jgi:predicted secreted protein
VRVITIDDNGKEIRVKHGDLFRIELEAPGTTGYLWQVEDLDASRLDLINQSTRVLLSDGRMGAPSVSVFTFRAISEGSVMLTIEYYRPWEGRAKSEKTFSVTINII